jgi:hypothetical protein
MVVAGVNFYQDSYEWMHVGFLPYLIITPGIVYFSYQRKGRFGKLLPLVFTILLFMLPLVAIWWDVRSTGNIMSGFLPYNDASDYYTDALGLLDGQLFTGLSIRRPIFAAFLSFLFSITNRNLQLTLLFLVLINAVLCYFFAQQIKNLWGSAAAAIVTVLLFFFYRRFTGTTLTENLGFALSMAGSAIILLGTQKADQKNVLFGIFMLSLVMNVRPGALLVLPVIVLWGSWVFRGKTRLSVSFLVVGVIAVALGFLINWGTEKLVVEPEISASKTGMFSNYSNTFYGLAAGGKGWAHIYTIHPELREMANKESLIYDYAFESIRQNPFLFITGMANSFVDFFSPRYGAFSFLYASTSDPCTMEDFLQSLSSCQSHEATGKISCFASTIRLRMIDILSSLVMALLLLIPFCWGIWMCYQKRELPWCSVLLAIMIGILISVPLVPPRDTSKMRVYAMTQPLMVTIAAVGFLDLAKLLSEKTKVRWFSKIDDKAVNQPRPGTSWGLVISCLILSIAVIISPFAAKLQASEHEPVNTACPAGLEERRFRFNPGSSIELVQENATSLTWSGIRAPIPRFRDNLEKFCVSTDAEAAVLEELIRLQSGTVLLKPAFTGQSRDAQLIVISSSEVPHKPAYITICGEEVNGIFYSQSIRR